MYSVPHPTHRLPVQRIRISFVLIWILLLQSVVMLDQIHTDKKAKTKNSWCTVIRNFAGICEIFALHPRSDPNTAKWCGSMRFRISNTVFRIPTRQRNKYRKFETNIPRKGIARPQSQFPHSCVCWRFIYFHDRSAYFAAVLVVLAVFVFPWGLEHPGVFLPGGLLTQGCFQVA